MFYKNSRIASITFRGWETHTNFVEKLTFLRYTEGTVIEKVTIIFKMNLQNLRKYLEIEIFI